MHESTDTSLVTPRVLCSTQGIRRRSPAPAVPDYGFEGLLVCGEAPNVIAAGPDWFAGEGV